MPDQTDPFIGNLSQIVNEIVGILPQLLAAFVVLLLGWLIAKLLRAFTMRSGGFLNRSIHSVGARFGTSITGLRDTSVRLIAGVVYWIAILCFTAAASSILGLSMFTGWLDRIVAALPNILSGVFIIFAGVVLSNIARDSTEAAFGSLSGIQRTYLARAAQFFTLALLAIVGFEQLGVDVTVITTVLGIVLACLFGGLAIAFSLGARTFVGNLIGAHYLQRDYVPGEHLRIGDYSGTIVAITNVAVILESPEGRLSVPARLFSEQPTLLVHGETGDE